MTNIRANDLVLHKPSGEKWIVCGVNNEQGRLIPCGYPFPSMADIADCELIAHGSTSQTKEQADALRRYGLESFVEVSDHDEQ